MRAQEAVAARHEDPHRTATGRRLRIEPVDSSDPALAVRRVPGDRLADALLPRHEGYPSGFPVQLVVADAEGLHVAGSGAVALRDAHDLTFGPVAVLGADPEDQACPVCHRDVVSLAVAVDVAGDAVDGDHQVAPDAIRAEAEVAHRLEVSELDDASLERLGDHRTREVARVLAGSVVVEHPRDDAWHAVGVVVVHRQKVGGDLCRRVDRLRVDRRALVQDDAAVLVEVVVAADLLADVSVLLRRAGGVELLELELPVDDGLEQVEGAHDVRHRRLVRPVPRLADVRLRGEVEHVRPVGCFAQATDRPVDRVTVGEVAPVNGDAPTMLRDVVEGSARRGTDEGVDVCAQTDKGVDEMRAHEAVGAGDERRASRQRLGELFSQRIGSVSTHLAGGRGRAACGGRA